MGHLNLSGGEIFSNSAPWKGTQSQQQPVGGHRPLSRQRRPAASPDLCKAAQHVLPGDPHVVQLQEAIVHVLKVHLGPDVPNGDS